MSFGQRSFIVPQDPSIEANNFGVRRMLDIAVNVIWFSFGVSAITLLVLGVIGVLTQEATLLAITALAFFSAVIVFLMDRFAPFIKKDGSDVPNGE